MRQKPNGAAGASKKMPINYCSQELCGLPLTSARNVKSLLSCVLRWIVRACHADGSLVWPLRMLSTTARAYASNVKVTFLLGFSFMFGQFDCISGIIDRWDNPERQSAVGWCSWCFRNEAHMLFQQNTFTRDVYNCAACTKRTLPCRRCSGIAFAKGHPDWDDELCLVCDGSLPNWSSFSSAGLVIRKYCSQCNILCIHKLEDKCIVRASIYRCQGCKQMTTPCSSCDTGAVIKETAMSLVLDLAAEKARCRSCKSGVSWIKIAQETKKGIQVESESSIRSRTNRECEGLLAHIHGSCSKPYARDFMLSEQGKPCSQVIIVEEGCCRAEVQVSKGKNAIVADDLDAGETLGELGFLTKGISKASIYIHSATAKCSVVTRAAIMESMQPGKKPINSLRSDIFFRYLAIKLVQRFQDMIAGREPQRKVSSNMQPVSTSLVDPEAERHQFIKTVFRLPSNEHCILVADSCCKIRQCRPVFGRVYLMNSFFGFHGNVFGFETTYIWALNSVSEVQELGDSTEIGFHLKLSGQEMDEDDERPVIVAGIVIKMPEPKFRFDCFDLDVRNEFVRKFRELLATSKFNHLSVSGGSHIINDIHSIRLHKQKELEDFRKRQVAMSRFSNQGHEHKKSSSDGFLSMFMKRPDSKPATAALSSDQDDAELEIDDMDIDAVVDGVEISSYNLGDVILLQGSTEHNLYQIARGSANVEINGKIIATISAGTTFGEISFILGSAANATVSAAVDDLLIYSIDGKFIKTMLQRSRRITASFFRFLAEIIASKIKGRKLAAAVSTNSTK
jgi:CRP-like cAMP-binding protein